MKLLPLGVPVLILAAVCIFAPLRLATAQTIGAAYSSAYTATNLGAIPGSSRPVGAMAFLLSDPTADTLLFAAPAFNSAGQIFSIQVVRGTGNHITGFTGSLTLVATTPNVDSCLVYGPSSISGASSILFYETFASPPATNPNANLVGELKPGSSAPDKTVSMTAKGVTSSMGGLDFVPAGSGYSASAVGHLKLQSFTGNTFYDATISSDGTGTFDVSNATQTASVSGGPGLAGMKYVTATSPLFPTHSIFLDEFGPGQVVAFQTDTNGDPIVSSAQTFLTFTHVDGAVVDPLTGDYLFSNGDGSVASNIAEVQGFAAPTPEPGTWTMVALGIALLLGTGRSRKRQGLIA